MGDMYNKYLVEAQENKEQLFDIKENQDIDDFVMLYNDSMLEFFKEGDYSLTDEGKLRCIKDFLRRRNIILDFSDESFSIDDIIEEFDWNDKSFEREVVFEKLESFMESINDFIDEYRMNDSYEPSFRKILRHWINELEDIYDELDD